MRRRRRLRSRASWSWWPRVETSDWWCRWAPELEVRAGLDGELLRAVATLGGAA